MLINGREINYIDAQLKMACNLEERAQLYMHNGVNKGHEVLMRKANYHLILAEDADEQREVEAILQEEQSNDKSGE